MSHRQRLHDLADDAALADSVSTAFLVMLERLSPEQRAVLLLRDVFALPVADVAGIIGKSEEATRQIATRARRLVREGRPRRSADAVEAEQLAARFFAAAREVDLPGLVELLVDDAEFVGDGGDSGRGLTRIVTGTEAVAHIVRGVFNQLAAVHGRAEPVWVGLQPAALMLDAEDHLAAVWSLVVDDGKVVAVHGMVNPDKLGHLAIPLTTLVGRTTHADERQGT